MITLNLLHIMELFIAASDIFDSLSNKNLMSVVSPFIRQASGCLESAVTSFIDCSVAIMLVEFDNEASCSSLSCLHVMAASIVAQTTVRLIALPA